MMCHVLFCWNFGRKSIDFAAHPPESNTGQNGRNDQNAPQQDGGMWPAGVCQSPQPGADRHSHIIGQPAGCHCHTNFVRRGDLCGC